MDKLPVVGVLLMVGGLAFVGAGAELATKGGAGVGVAGVMFGLILIGIGWTSVRLWRNGW